LIKPLLLYFFRIPSSFLLFSLFFNAPSTTDIYTLSLHDALPIYNGVPSRVCVADAAAEASFQLQFLDVDDLRTDKNSGGARREGDRKSTRLNSSHVAISYAVFCLKKKKKKKTKRKRMKKKKRKTR